MSDSGSHKPQVSRVSFDIFSNTTTSGGGTSSKASAASNAIASDLAAFATLLIAFRATSDAFETATIDVAERRSHEIRFKGRIALRSSELFLDR